MTRTLLTAAVAAAATLAAPGAARAGYVLDTFNTPSTGTLYFITFTQANPYVQSDFGISAGVDRTVTVKVNDPPLNPTSANGTIGGGRLDVNSDIESSVTTQIAYTLTGAAGNLSGATGVALDFLGFDAGTGFSTTPVTVDIDTASGPLSRTIDVMERVDANGRLLPFTESFDFGQSLGTVNSIRITINGGTTPQTAVDFFLNDVRVVKPVPAPPAVLLAGVGLLGLVGRARFRRPTA